jgi:hypothetical protein
MNSESTFLQEAAHILLVVAFDQNLSLEFVDLRVNCVFLVFKLEQALLDVLSQIFVEFL